MNFKSPARIALTVCAALLASIPAAAANDWIRLTTTHFEMYTTADQKVAREAILHFERVREFFLQASPVRPPGEFPTRIIAFTNLQEFHFYAPNNGVSAYYVPGPLRDSISMESPSPENYRVAIHEYVHLVIRHSGLRVPLWLNEGWAEVYSTLKPVKDGVAVGDLIQSHMAVLGQGQWFSLNELAAITPTSHDYNESSRTGMFYAESWALAHMLYLSPEYKNNFGKFIDALNKGRSMDEALQTAFGKTGDQVLTDLRSYFGRKKLYGTVFLTPFEKSGESPVVTPVAPYDSGLMLADLAASSNHLSDANETYKKLEVEDPKRPEAFAGNGYAALKAGDKKTAREDFTKAFQLGSTDPQLCMQLSALDREAKQPAGVIMGDLERAVALRPDFTEALFELGALKVDARDFDAALSLLSRVNAVAPDRVVLFQTAVAYSYLERGDIADAGTHVELARHAMKTTAEKQRVAELSALIQARSKGPAAAHPGEKTASVQGTALGLRCAAKGSGALSVFGVLVNGRQMLFDLPDPSAIEVVRPKGALPQMKCGPLQAFTVTVEYVPGSVLERTSAGIVRRLVF